MQQIQPVREVLSLFGIVTQPQVLKNNLAQHRLLVSLVSAFFIVLISGWIMSVTFGFLGVNQRLTVTANEPVAFLPTQELSNRVSQGYLNLYR
ncbi:MAG: hypothetical protein WCW26_01980 [Candidatus Buchananbacteria bacterium]